MTFLKRIYQTQGEMPDTHALIAETLEKEGIEVYIVTYQISDSIYDGKLNWISVKESDYVPALIEITQLISSGML